MEDVIKFISTMTIEVIPFLGRFAACFMRPGRFVSKFIPDSAQSTTCFLIASAISCVLYFYNNAQIPPVFLSSKNYIVYLPSASDRAELLDANVALATAGFISTSAMFIISNLCFTVVALLFSLSVSIQRINLVFRRLVYPTAVFILGQAVGILAGFFVSTTTYLPNYVTAILLVLYILIMVQANIVVMLVAIRIIMGFSWLMSLCCLTFAIPLVIVAITFLNPVDIYLAAFRSDPQRAVVESELAHAKELHTKGEDKEAKKYF